MVFILLYVHMIRLWQDIQQLQQDSCRCSRAWQGEGGGKVPWWQRLMCFRCAYWERQESNKNSKKDLSLSASQTSTKLVKDDADLLEKIRELCVSMSV